MKKTILGLSLIITFLLGFTLNTYSAGATTTKNYNFKGFTALDVTNGIKLEVKQGEQYEVKIQADQNVFPKITVAQKGAVLKLALKPLTGVKTPVAIAVTMPSLAKLNVKNGCNVKLTMNLSGKTLNAVIATGSSLTGSLQAGTFQLVTSEGSQAAVTGQAETLNIESKNGCRLQLEKLIVKNAKLKLSSGSAINVNVTGTLDIDASSGSTVYYQGNPKLGKTTVTADSSMKRQ